MNGCTFLDELLNLSMKFDEDFDEILKNEVLLTIGRKLSRALQNLLFFANLDSENIFKKSSFKSHAIFHKVSRRSHSLNLRYSMFKTPWPANDHFAKYFWKFEDDLDRQCMFTYRCSASSYYYGILIHIKGVFYS